MTYRTTLFAALTAVTLIPLAGHGVQFKDDPDHYFCPADAKIADKATLISLNEVYAALEKCPASVKVLLVDACRNDPLTQNGTRSATVGFIPSDSRPPFSEPP